MIVKLLQMERPQFIGAFFMKYRVLKRGHRLDSHPIKFSFGLNNYHLNAAIFTNG
jgi:hypothetical protein